MSPETEAAGLKVDFLVLDPVTIQLLSQSVVPINTINTFRRCKIGLVECKIGVIVKQESFSKGIDHTILTMS